MTFLVDTNVISAARRGRNEAVSWLRSVDPGTIYISVVTLGEVMRGIAAKQRTDPAAAASLTAWLAKIRRDHGARILPISDAIALTWGRLAAQRPRGDMDALIAATALVHGLVLVTRSTEDVIDTGVTLIDPWAA